MSARDHLKERFPSLAGKLPKLPLASLPTPASQVSVSFPGGERTFSIKYDNLTSTTYGGNKVRKLEYIFARAVGKGCKRVATFGAAGSNHALATSLYARDAGLQCTCFLSHQAKAPQVAATLNRHIENETEIVRFGGAYASRLQTLRKSLWNRRAWVIPMGGSSWLGNIGFVAAGLELAGQIRNSEIPLPDRIYVGAGTMGTAIGIALGLASADLHPEIHAIRVSHTSICNESAIDRLLQKTVSMMRRLDPAVPAALASRTSIHMRHEFFGPGYAQSTPATDAAIRFARDQLDLELEPTYTGKTMAALLADFAEYESAGRNVLYWHTYNSARYELSSDRPLDAAALPEEFLRYFE